MAEDRKTGPQQLDEDTLKDVEGGYVAWTTGEIVLVKDDTQPDRKLRKGDKSMVDGFDNSSRF